MPHPGASSRPRCIETMLSAGEIYVWARTLCYNLLINKVLDLGLRLCPSAVNFIAAEAVNVHVTALK